MVYMYLAIVSYIVILLEIDKKSRNKTPLCFRLIYNLQIKHNREMLLSIKEIIQQKN